MGLVVGVGVGVGLGLGFGLGLGPGQVLHELTKEKKRMLRERKRAIEAVFLLEPISQTQSLTIFLLLASA